MSALSDQVASHLAPALQGSWWGHFTGVIILLLMAVFIGIWIWAWRPRHAATFRRLASMPMEDMRLGAERKQMPPRQEEEGRS